MSTTLSEYNHIQKLNIAKINNIFMNTKISNVVQLLIWTSNDVSRSIVATKTSKLIYLSLF